MKKTVQIAFIIYLLIGLTSIVSGQENMSKDSDIRLKESLYKQYKKEVLAFDKKDFDALFFEFFSKHKDEKLTLTKEAYYTYTIKIAIYSEKLGFLYKDQKENAQRTKLEWFEKNYDDYLQSKK
jgi:hypothetical protein